MKTVRWRLHLRSSPGAVFELLSTNQGRARFWAESAVERDGAIDFVFPNGYRWRGEILETVPNQRFAVNYFAGPASFELRDDGAGGTELTLTHEGLRDKEYPEINAGWASVLMALKGAADFGVDLRNHRPDRSWDQGFVDN